MLLRHCVEAAYGGDAKIVAGRSRKQPKVFSERPSTGLAEILEIDLGICRLGAGKGV